MAKAKMIVTGHIIEVWHYEHDIQVGKRQPKEPLYDLETGEIIVVSRKEKTLEQVRLDNCRRSRNELRRLISANFSERSKFLTVTFRDGAVKDVHDVEECNKQFGLFIKRLKYETGEDLKYAAVIEFQDKYGRGAVHYHVICDLKYIPYERLLEIWGLGGVWINQINHVDNVGAYVTAYMTKDNLDDRLRGKKAYMTSRGNLTRPIKLYGYDALELEEEYCKDEQKVFTNSYISEHQGLVSYAEYNPKRSITQNDIKKNL